GRSSSAPRIRRAPERRLEVERHVRISAPHDRRVHTRGQTPFQESGKGSDPFSMSQRHLMKFSSKGLILIFAAVAIAWVAVFSFAVTGTKVSAQGATPKPQMSEEVYKNIQVLKGIPVD